MPSPFHQKYATQTHKVFGDNTTPSLPEGTMGDRRASDASVGSNPSSPTERRRSSASRFANLEALKRPTDEQSTQRRASLQDSYSKPGILGSWWNNFTRGPQSPPNAAPQQQKAPKDTTTLRQ